MHPTKLSASTRAASTRAASTLAMSTPLGWLTLIADGDCLIGVRFGASAGDQRQRTSGWTPLPVLRQTRRELDEFFEGNRRVFSVPMRVGGTSFQNRVWRGLCAIPFGSTCSYGELARRAGSPRGARAVGMALNRNPLAIVVPCHRVIGADGSLVGFAGGLDVKSRLLEHEAQYL